MIALFRIVLYQCGMVIALSCGIAAATILLAIVTNKLSGGGLDGSGVFRGGRLLGLGGWLAAK